MDEFFFSIESIHHTKSAWRFSSAMDLILNPPCFPPPSPSIKAMDEAPSACDEMKEALEQVQIILGYSFKDLSLLEEALTHSSISSRASYQRLEFIGDAVLNLAFSNFVYLTNLSGGPGALSILRAANISTEKLARVAIRHDFYRYLCRNSPRLDLSVKEFTEAVSKEREGDYAEISYGGSTVKAPKVLADIVESIAAAIYMDCRFDLVEFWKVFRGILEPIITVDTPNQQPVTHLYELCQKHGMSVKFKNWRDDNVNITNVLVDGELLGVGSSEQRPIAKLNAARHALQNLCSDEVNHMSIRKCFPQTSEIWKDQAPARQTNGRFSSAMDLTLNPPWFPPPSPSIKAMDEAPSACDEIMEALEQVQIIVGYSFEDLSLLEEALTHSSFSSRTSYQRLEFIGDAVLNLAFSNFVYLTNLSGGPGALSILRAANISTEKLARVAIRHDFYRYLRRNSPRLDLSVKEFTEAVSKEREGDYAEISYGGSTVKAPKVLADIVESIAAAIYIDCRFDLVEFWKVFRGILEPIITVDTPNQQPVTHLYELCQKHGMSVEFKNWRDDNVNITNVLVDGELLGVGSSEQKPIAKLNAARHALQNLCSDEVDHMSIDKCFPQTSEIWEDQAPARHTNGGLVLSKAYANGVEEVDGSKQRLHELCSKMHWKKPIYSLEKKQGPAHDMRFLCSVKVVSSSRMLFASGDPKSRLKEAENSAAHKLLSQLQFL